MEFYDEKDMKYWQKQSELGRAVIIKIPVSMLLDLDISSLSRTKSQAVTSDDLDAWMEQNREEILRELAKVAAEKEEVEKLGQKLYHKDDAVPEKKPAIMAEAKPAAVAEDAAGTVASIMSRELFNDEQIEVIAEAMLEGLPEKYMLCFLKKDYSPEIMRKLKDYCTRLYREEVSGRDGSR